jgi:hypothetical protein
MSGGTLAVAGQTTFTGGTDVFYGGSTVDAGSLQVGFWDRFAVRC